MTPSLLIAWLIYVTSGLVLLLLAHVLLQRWWPEARAGLLVAMAILIFTPGPSEATFTHIGPAIIGVLFNVMSHSWLGVVRSVLPLTVVGALVTAVMGWRTHVE